MKRDKESGREMGGEGQEEFSRYRVKITIPLYRANDKTFPSIIRALETVLTHFLLSSLCIYEFI